MSHPPEPARDQPQPRGGDLVRRHHGFARLWHWVNAVAVLVMLMSGLMIFNAHPRLYWGEYGSNAPEYRDPAWLDLTPARGGPAFPGWMTIPGDYSLADARLWHLAFAWLLAVGLALYLLWALIGGHARRDLALSARELTPRRVLHDIAEHARLRFPTGAAALRYNVLQKLAYSVVLFVLLPGIILTGLTMSPGLNAAWPWLLDLFGGRQSARSLHFVFAGGLAGFIVVHLIMVVLAGPINELRSMITGWYRLPPEREDRA